jgi:hypothetical protein
MNHPISRRAILAGLTGGGVAAMLGDAARGADGELLRADPARPTSGAGGAAATTRAGEALPSVRRITRGPGFHWFGYYDKLQFDPAGRLVLGMRVEFEHRSPKPDDEIRLGYVDLHDGERWTEIGATRAWNWQQGCMLQWLPGSETEVIWNSREDGRGGAKEGRFISHVLDVKSGATRTLPGPIYAVSPDASWAVYPDFRRLNDTRPGYGYAGVPDPNVDKLAPDDAGIWRMDLRSGDTRLIVRLADIVNVPQPPGAKGSWDATSKHWFNHLLVSPDGKRFIFLHRWRGEKEGKSFSTRMFTAAADGSDLYVLDPSGKTSHFIWRDPQHIAMWTWHASRGERFYLFTDKADEVEPIGPDVMTVNGHNTYLPVKGQPGRWILNDTYPDASRLQHPFLYDTRTGTRHPLGHFHSPREYAGEWRCDTHPRSSPDGMKVCIDSPHEGGRQMYVIDVSGIVGGA